MIRIILLLVISMAGMQSSIASSNPGSTELMSIVQDDDRFTVLLTEIWLLRDILALEIGGDISADAREFQGLVNQLISQQTSIVDKLRTNPTGANLPDNYQDASGKITAALDKFGVRQDSELGTRLVVAFEGFSELLSIESLEPLCGLYPFHSACGP